MSKKIEKIKVDQDLADFYSAMPLDARLALIRQEVHSYQRLKIAKLDKDSLRDLVVAKRLPEKESKQLLKGDLGDSTYRALWHKDLSHEFGYSLPGAAGKRVASGVDREYNLKEDKEVVLDVVNAVVNLAYLGREGAQEDLKLKSKYFMKLSEERKEKRAKIVHLKDRHTQTDAEWATNDQ